MIAEEEKECTIEKEFSEMFDKDFERDSKIFNMHLDNDKDNRKWMSSVITLKGEGLKEELDYLKSK